MAGTCVVGLQWGDEAKGKIVDLIGDQFDFVGREVVVGGAVAEDAHENAVAQTEPGWMDDGTRVQEDVRPVVELQIPGPE